MSDEMQTDRPLTLRDWEIEDLRRDRLREQAEMKLQEIAKIVGEHQHCDTTCDAVIEIAEVIHG